MCFIKRILFFCFRGFVSLMFSFHWGEFEFMILTLVYIDFNFPVDEVLRVVDGYLFFLVELLLVLFDFIPNDLLVLFYCFYYHERFCVSLWVLIAFRIWQIFTTFYCLSSYVWLFLWINEFSKIFKNCLAMFVITLR